MKPAISRQELKRRLLQCGGISPDDAENAAVLELFEALDLAESNLSETEFDFGGSVQDLADSRRQNAALTKAMRWWRDRCRETQRHLEYTVRWARVQAGQLAMTAQRAEKIRKRLVAIETKLQAAEEALSREATPMLSSLPDATNKDSDRERFLEQALSVYARDEERFLNGEGEPFGSIPTEIGAFAREVRRVFELKLLVHEATSTKPKAQSPSNNVTCQHCGWKGSEADLIAAEACPQCLRSIVDGRTHDAFPETLS